MDSGFIALGLAQLDARRSLECIRAYTSEPSDPNYADVQHGTPLLVQIYAFRNSGRTSSIKTGPHSGIRASGKWIFFSPDDPA